MTPTRVAQKKRRAKPKLPKSIEDLAPAPYNPRKISKKAAKGLRKSLDTFADISGIVWNKRTGHLVTGHQRVQQLRQLGAKFVRGELVVGGRKFPIRIVDWPIGKEKAANVEANNLGIAGEFTADLQGLLDEIQIDFDLEPLCLDTLLDRNTEVEQDEIPEPPKKPVTKLGDVWVLGRHCIVCGDSTDKYTVALALDGSKPSIMNTDPPYGVELDLEWRGRAGANPLGVNRSGKVVHDDRSSWLETWKLSPLDIAYVWHASAFSDVVMSDLRESGFEIRQQIIWVKDVMALSRSAYHWKHEPCWYAVRKGKTAKWIGDRKQVTTWNAAAPNHIMGSSKDDHTLHPTQKPISIMARPIQNHNGDLYDPFLGSGTTLIAAEQLGRKCHGVELSPAYCDVIRQNRPAKKKVRRKR